MDNINTNSTPKPKGNPGTGCLVKLVGAAVLMFIIWWIGNYMLIITEEKIESDKIKDDVKICVLSDLHASDGIFSISNETIIRKIKKINPDVVCVLGDMHSSDASEEEKEISLNLMRGIVAENYKTFFVLGEHDDRSNGYISKMEKSGIDVLDQESEEFEINGNKITFYGISNAWFSEYFDLENDFKLNEDTYNILLAHIPNYDAYNKFGADLTLCADTHGGIIQVPFLGPAHYEGDVFPEIFEDQDEVYDKGLFKTRNGYMFITSGIGNYPVPARFNNLPEIAEITVTKKSG